MKVFEEAYSHTRRKEIMRNIIKNIHLSEYKNKTFEEILSEVSINYGHINGIGPLALYDITSGICKHHTINIDKVYIIGPGPIRAIKLLKVKTIKQKFAHSTLAYAEINDIIKAFDLHKVEVPVEMRHSKNGDAFESFLCRWQKTIK